MVQGAKITFNQTSQDTNCERNQILLTEVWLGDQTWICKVLAFKFVDRRRGRREKRRRETKNMQASTPEQLN